jgi:hypothetical protein
MRPRRPGTLSLFSVLNFFFFFFFSMVPDEKMQKLPAAGTALSLFSVLNFFFFFSMYGPWWEDAEVVC